MLGLAIKKSYIIQLTGLLRSTNKAPHQPLLLRFRWHFPIIAITEYCVMKPF